MICAAVVKGTVLKKFTPTWGTKITVAVTYGFKMKCFETSAVFIPRNSINTVVQYSYVVIGQNV